MLRPASLRLALLAFALLPLLTAGCSSGPGQGFGAAFGFSQSHKMLDTTKGIRLANAQPLQVPRELEKQPLPPYIVEPGDVLLIQPVKLDSPVRLPPDQTVLPDGKIDLGEYGRVLVAGKTVEAVEAAVQAIVQAKTPEAGMINVRLVGRNSKVYYVLGQVNAPGSFPLQGRETVLDGIVAAGGLNTRASRANIIVSRPTVPEGCRIVLPVCYPQIVQLGDTTTNYQLQPGDRVYVPAMSFWESLCGEDKDDKKGCTPCKRPQRACPWDCTGPAAVPTAVPGTALVLPAPQEMK